MADDPAEQGGRGDASPNPAFVRDDTELGILERLLSADRARLHRVIATEDTPEDVRSALAAEERLLSDRRRQLHEELDRSRARAPRPPSPA